MTLKVSKHNFFLYVALVLLNVYYGLNNTTFKINKTEYLLLIAIFILCIYIFLFQRLDFNKLFLYLGMFTAFSINYIKEKDSRMIVVLITILAIRSIDLKTVLRLFFYTRMLLFGLTVSLSMLGVTELIIIIKDRGRRYALGYTHPNQFMFVLCMLIMMSVCLYYSKLTGIHFIGLFMVLILGFLVSKSYTGLIICSMTLFLVVSYKYFRLEKMLCFLGKYFPGILMFLSLFLPLTLKADLTKLSFFTIFPGIADGYMAILKGIDSALSSRLTLSRITLLKTKFGLFGSATGTLRAKYTLVDSGYVQLVLVFGILGCFLFLALNWLMVKQMVRRKQYVYICAFIGLALYAFTENMICSLGYNFALIFAAEVFETKRYGYLVKNGEGISL